MEAVAEDAFSVILPSHLIADLGRVCDYLIVLAGSRVLVAGPIDELRASHHRVTGPRRGRVALAAGKKLITVSYTDVQSTLMVRHHGPILDPAWSVSDVSREDLVLANIGREMHGSPAARTLRGGVMIRVSYWPFRLPLGTAFGGLVFVAAVADLTGPGLVRLYNTTVATCASNGGYCSTALSSFNARDRALRAAAQTILLGLRAVLGMFWGAPLVARELESGTFRLAWTQGRSRMRWLGGKLLSPGSGP